MKKFLSILFLFFVFSIFSNVDYLAGSLDEITQEQGRLKRERIRNIKIYRENHPLHAAIFDNNFKKVMELVSEETINKVDNKNITPLMMGASRIEEADRKKFIELLINKGADRKVSGELGVTALHFLILKEDLKGSFLNTVKQLLSGLTKEDIEAILGAKVGRENQQTTIFHILAKKVEPKPMTEIFSYLLEKAGDKASEYLKTPDWLGKTPLHKLAEISLKNKKEEEIKKIFDAQKSMAEKMIEKGVVVNLQDNTAKKKYTPLHYAVMANNKDLIKFLFDNGAKDIEGIDGKKPSDLAMAGDTKKLLEKAFGKTKFEEFIRKLTGKLVPEGAKK